MARYVGGPCNGQDAGPALFASSFCGGKLYSIGGDGNYHLVPVSVLSGPQGSGLKGVVSAEAAWASLQEALGRNTQKSLARVMKAATKIRRAAR